MANEAFHKELNQHFEQVFDSTSKAVIDTVKDGNMTSLATVARVASAALGGLQVNIIELCIGVITKNVIQITDSL